MAQLAKICVVEVSTGTAARILNVSQDTVMRYCEEGILRARRTKDTGWWRIQYDSLLEYSTRIRASKLS